LWMYECLVVVATVCGPRWRMMGVVERGERF
jgi:hypothetical protein